MGMDGKYERGASLVTKWNQALEIICGCLNSKDGIKFYYKLGKLGNLFHLWILWMDLGWVKECLFDIFVTISFSPDKILNLTFPLLAG